MPLNANQTIVVRNLFSKPEDDIEDEPLDIIEDVESDEPQGDSNEVSGATTDGGQTSAADLLDSGDIPDVGDIDEPTLF